MSTTRVKRSKTDKKIQVTIEIMLELESDELDEIEEVLEKGRERGSAEVVDITIITPKGGKP